MSKNFRKFLGLLLCLSLVLSGMAAQAGSLSMSVKSAKAKGLENLAGVQFELFRIGQPDSGAESAWAPVSPFDGEGGVTFPAGTVGKDGKATWTAEQIDAIIGQADDVITKKSVEGTIKSTDATGKVEFTDLDAGVYYVRKVENTRPLRLTVKPFLVTIPSLSEQNPEDINFDLSAQGKMDYETPGEKTVSVEKKWEDDDNFDGIRPPEVTVHLKRTYIDHFTGDEVTEDSDAADATVKLNEGNDWSHEWKGLPDSNYDKAPYTYSVVEDEVPGYEIEITGGEEAGFTITNTHTPKYGAIELTKKVTVDDETPAGDLLNYADGVYHFTITGPTDADYAALGIKKVEKDPNDAKKVYNYLDAETFDITITGGKASTWGTDHLVPGTYTIVETGKDDGELPEGMSLIGDSPLEVVVVEGTTKDSPTKAELTNNQETGKLIIKKEVWIGYDDASKSGDPTLADGTYKFTLTGDANGQQLTKEIPITITNGESNTAEVDNLLPGEYTITEDTRNLPEGVELVSENLPEGYTAPVDDALKVTVEAGEEAEVKVATFVNNRAVGALAINKKVVSDAAADHEMAFTFTLTLDEPINGTFDAYDGNGGTVTFKDGVTKFELKDEEGVYIYGLPAGAHYTVTEESVDDFTTTWEAEEVDGTEVTEDGVSGVILEEEVPFITIDVTNTRDTGDLTVSKALVSDADADKGRYFTFTVTLDDKTITGEYGDVEFKDGVATVTLKGGESKTAEGLPIGVGYTITEEEAEGFQQTGKTGDTGTISKTEAKAEITNTRETGDLEVSKIVISDAAADKDQEFEFTVKLSDKTITGTYGDMTFDKGEATFKLKGGESVIAEGLPTDVTYIVTEEGVKGFELESKVGDTGTISTTKSEATFTNKREVGDLVVRKKVVSSTEADKQKEFNFTVTLSDNTIEGEYGEMTFTKGVATFTLKDGETKTAEGLPTDIEYTVVEASDAAFETTKSNDKGTITTSPITAGFTNTRKEGDLIVIKAVVSDLEADHQKDFTFTVTIDDENVTGTYGGMEFNKGVATFTLKDTESVKAEGLPDGVSYTVVETDEEDFTVTYKGETGKIEEKADGKTPVTCVVTNTRKTGELEVKKVVVTQTAGDKSLAFDFTVTLSDTTLTKTYGDMVFRNGVATFSLTDGKTATAKGLPTGITYTVTEAEAKGFELTGKTGDTGTITTTKSESVFTNTRTTGGLAIKKRVTVNGQSTTTSTLADGTYRFNIVGPNNYRGTASITITNGVSNYAYIDDLEPGTYTVSEVTTGLPNRVSLSGGNNKRVTVVAGMQGSELVTFDKKTTKTTAETNALQAGMADFLNAYTTPPPGGGGNTPTPTPYVTETPEPTPTPTPEPTPTPVTSLNGQKVWNDESNTHRTRPATITVQLLRDGVVVSSNTVRGSSNTWRFTFNNLPAVDENGTPYSYSIRESGVTGYTTTVNGTTIVNDLIPRTPQNYTNINGTKTWNDDNNSAGDRPNYITVRLLRDGREIERRTVTAANGWQYSFTNLPVDDGYGNIYSYSIREDTVPGYFARTNGYDLTNTRLPDEPVTMIDYDTPLAGLQEEELEDLVDLFDYGTPLWGELLKTGDETPIYPFIFGGVGVAALAALILLTVFGKKKKEEGA